MVTESGVCLIVAHDAGGAEILSCYVQQNQFNYSFVLEGPAIKVFQRKFFSLKLLDLQSGVEQADWVLCGTSWQSDIEWQAIKLAKQKGVPTVSFIDHWVNYPQRFIRKDIQHLPDEIWIGDSYAQSIAKETFPNTPIKIVENPYLLEIEKEFNLLKQVEKSHITKKTLLFISENLSGHALLKYSDKNHFGYTEFDAISFLLKNLNYVDKNIDKVIIRPHPSDAKGKYDTFVKQSPDEVEIAGNSSLLNNIFESDVIAGCESMALVVALKVGKKVLSCIPTDQPCRLPHREIIDLKQLVK